VALFRRLYDKVLSWSSHQHAPYYLAGVSFVESSFFPIPPDVMLIPMIMSKPSKIWRYTFITILASVIGGLFGYALGFYAFETIGLPMINALALQSSYEKAVQWFAHYGFIAVLIAGFTPIPYKLFTIAAGVSQMALLPFIVASILGRTLRFLIVAGLVRLLGKRLEPMILKYIEKIGWGMIALLVIGLLLYNFA
jgi:membrane protein YqaA with SNARE-associated domain